MSNINEEPTEVTFGHEVISNIETWPTPPSSDNLGDNSQLYYIAVEYVSGNELDSALDSSSLNETCPEFVVSQDISPANTNTSSDISCYPIEIQCEKNDNYGGIIIQQYDSEEIKENEQFVSYITSKNEEGHFASQSLIGKTLRKPQNLELIPSIMMSESDFASGDVHQDVQLLISDEMTDKLVSLNTKELLAENCLSNVQQLLILPSTLESDSNSLNPTEVDMLENCISAPTLAAESDEIMKCVTELTSIIEEKRTRGRSSINPVDEEIGLLSCVYNIEDKPILSRARASLPEFYLTLDKVMDEDVVYAKKVIPKRTQFGPLKGILDECKIDESDTNFLLQVDGKTYKVVVSDEGLTNWMAFVRRAITYEEQNLIVSQEDGGLYFTTTKNISPKEELKVGYSAAYARQYNLKVLKPTPNKTWPCYECSAKFATSDELQNHFDFHDLENDENRKPKRKYKKFKSALRSKRSQIEMVECNMCHTVLNGGVGYVTLKRHIVEHHKIREVDIAEQFTILKGYQCAVCNIRFKMETLLNIHKLEHNLELPLDQPNHVCPQCQRKFPTRKQLVLHVSAHSIPQPTTRSDSFKCHVCRKVFAYSFRLQKHMLCHGSDDTKPLQCKICKKRFLTKSALSFHTKIHKPEEKNFGCVICKERFEHVYQLRHHVPEHAENHTYSCPHCTKKFSSYGMIRKHVRFHNAKEHHCPHCPKSFTTTDNLKKHLLRHSDHKEFLCADCGKQFKRKDKLADHIKKLHLQKPEGAIRRTARKVAEKTLKEPLDFHRFIYKCNLCLIGFKRRGMLVNHLAKRHPDIRPDSVPELNLPILRTTKDYLCQYCDKVYKSASKRKQHVLKVHPGEPLPSDKGKWTTPQTDIQTSSFPVATNVTTRPKKCQWCYRQYARRSKLLQHIRKMHPSKILDDQDINENLEKSEGVSSVTDTVTNLNKISDLPKELPESDAGLTINSENYYSKSKITTDGNLTEITPIDALIDDNSKYCHLSIDESEILGNDQLVNNSTHLFHLMSASNEIMPHR